MADREADEKEKMKRGLLARAKEHMENSPPLRRLSAVMRALRGEMQRRVAEGAALTPVGAYTDETEKVELLKSGTREDILKALQEMAFAGRITTGGVCVAGAGGDVIEIHGEERNLPKMPILCFEPLHPLADMSQPLRGRKKKTSSIIFAAGDPGKVN